MISATHGSGAGARSAGVLWRDTEAEFHGWSTRTLPQLGMAEAGAAASGSGSSVVGDAVWLRRDHRLGRRLDRLR